MLLKQPLTQQTEVCLYKVFKNSHDSLTLRSAGSMWKKICWILGMRLMLSGTWSNNQQWDLLMRLKMKLVKSDFFWLDAPGTWGLNHKLVVLLCQQPELCAWDGQIKDIHFLWHHREYRIEKKECLEPELCTYINIHVAVCNTTIHYCNNGFP